MSETEKKTKEEYMADVTSQLKEMRHYAETNTEKLSSFWLSFDSGEYKDPLFSEQVNILLNTQGKFHDEIEKVIQDIEIYINQH